MSYEDQLRSHPAYFKSALGAIEIYTAIHDNPSLTEEEISKPPSPLRWIFADSPAPEQEAERKKAAKKAQKAEQKAKKGMPLFRKSWRIAAAASGETKKEETPAPDPDPTGEILLKTETPLEEAYKLWTPLEKMASERVETWTSGFDIQIRRSKSLSSMEREMMQREGADRVGRIPAAFKCLLAAYEIGPDDPTLHRQLITFQKSRMFFLTLHVMSDL